MRTSGTLRLSRLIVAVCLFTPACAGSAQAPLSIAGVAPAAGTAASGTVTIAPRNGDAGASIPFTVIRGRTPGPVLLLVAGASALEKNSTCCG